MSFAVPKTEKIPDEFLLNRDLAREVVLPYWSGSVRVLDCTQLVQEAPAVSKPGLFTVDACKIFAVGTSFIGFGVPNVYMARVTAPGVVQVVAAKSLYREATRIVESSGRVQSGVFFVPTDVDPAAVEAAVQASVQAEGTKSVTCLNAVANILANAGFDAEGGGLRDYKLPHRMLDALLRGLGAEQDGRRLRLVCVKTTPMSLDEYRRAVRRATLMTPLRHLARFMDTDAAREERKRIAIEIEEHNATILAKRQEEAAQRRASTSSVHSDDSGEPRTFRVLVSETGSLGGFFRSLWGSHVIYKLQLDDPDLRKAVNEFLPERLKPFAKSTGVVSQVKRDVLFNRSVVSLLRSHIAAKSSEHHGFTQGILARMLDNGGIAASYHSASSSSSASVPSSESESNTVPPTSAPTSSAAGSSPSAPSNMPAPPRYNIVLTCSELIVVCNKVCYGFVDWIMSKHVLISGYSPDVRYAGELYRDQDGVLHITADSGTFRPTADQLRRVVKLARIIFDELEIVGDESTVLATTKGASEAEAVANTEGPRIDRGPPSRIGDRDGDMDGDRDGSDLGGGKEEDDEDSEERWEDASDTWTLTGDAALDAMWLPFTAPPATAMSTAEGSDLGDIADIVDMMNSNIVGDDPRVDNHPHRDGHPGRGERGGRRRSSGSSGGSSSSASQGEHDVNGNGNGNGNGNDDDDDDDGDDDAFFPVDSDTEDEEGAPPGAVRPGGSGGRSDDRANAGAGRRGLREDDPDAAAAHATAARMVAAAQAEVVAARESLGLSGIVEPMAVSREAQRALDWDLVDAANAPHAAGPTPIGVFLAKFDPLTTHHETSIEAALCAGLFDRIVPVASDVIPKAKYTPVTDRQNMLLERYADDERVLVFKPHSIAGPASHGGLGWVKSIVKVLRKCGYDPIPVILACDYAVPKKRRRLRSMMPSHTVLVLDPDAPNTRNFIPAVPLQHHHHHPSPHPGHRHRPPSTVGDGPAPATRPGAASHVHFDGRSHVHFDGRVRVFTAYGPEPPSTKPLRALLRTDTTLFRDDDPSCARLLEAAPLSPRVAHYVYRCRLYKKEIVAGSLTAMFRNTFGTRVGRMLGRVNRASKEARDTAKDKLARNGIAFGKYKIKDK